ncbi:MAG TPA: DUF167 family protein [Acetobacteraceae bacterium]|jgi:hypothetical protein
MFWRPVPGGVAVAVKVQPRSRRPGLHGPAESASGERLRVAVTAPPESGHANRAACATLAEALGLPASAVRVTAGAAAREKTLHVAGDPQLLAGRLASL